MVKVSGAPWNGCQVPLTSTCIVPEKVTGVPAGTELETGASTSLLGTWVAARRLPNAGLLTEGARSVSQANTALTYPPLESVVVTENCPADPVVPVATGANPTLAGRLELDLNRLIRDRGLG
jgi:hypothetical protein